METTSPICNVTKFRLLGTPEGDLLIRFFWLKLNPDAVNWHIAERLVSGDLARPILYEGSLVNNKLYLSAINNLLKR
jgi:hypothetical protein